jgi:hypothetical protein
VSFEKIKRVKNITENFQACQNLMKIELNKEFTDLTPDVQQMKLNGTHSSPQMNGENGSGERITPIKKPSKAKRDKMNPKEKRECEVVERLIKTYFLIVRKNIQVIILQFLKTNFFPNFENSISN